MSSRSSRNVTTSIFALDLRSLAVFRIGLGVLLLVDIYLRLQNLSSHYTDVGVLPRALVTAPDRFSFGWPFSFHLLSGGPTLQVILFGIQALAALCLTVGLQTRLATLVSWILLVSLQVRNPLVLQGGDVLMRLALLWSIFLPLGRCWSLDARATPNVQITTHWSIASVGLVLQICAVYWVSALLKSDPPWREEGTALFYILRYEGVQGPLGYLLLGHPGLTKLLTHSALAFEFFGPFLLFVPMKRELFRCLTVFLFVGFHLSTVAILSIGLFPFVAVVCWLAFLPSVFWKWLGRKQDGTERDSRSDSNGVLSNCAAAIICLVIICANVNEVWHRRAAFLPLQLIEYALHLDQRWQLFSPAQPLTGWFVFPGTLRDGTEVDLFNFSDKLTWTKPASVRRSYRGFRWQKYYRRLSQPEYAAFRPLLAYSLCLRWNQSHPPKKQLATLSLTAMVQTIQPDGSLDAPVPEVLWEGSCTPQ